MNLLKKFWHADIINKLYVLIILFIIVVASIAVITRNKKDNSEIQKNNAENETVKEVSETIVIKNTRNSVDGIKISEIEEKKETANQDSNKEQIKNNSEKTTENDKQLLINNKQENIEDRKVETEIKTQINKTEEIKDHSIENNNKEYTTAQEHSEDIKKEEYKENADMINTMKSFIQNNLSEDMINYGYEIVVDSSIVGSTNQFSYSEQRMTNFIKNRFGTIRIYARDYYYNGELVMTECYIL